MGTGNLQACIAVRSGRSARSSRPNETTCIDGSRNGPGLERIDLAEAKRRGIAVCHTPDELAEDVADGAIALTYAIMRRVVEADRFVRAGRWAKERMAPSRRM